MNIEDLKAVEVPTGALSYGEIDKSIKEVLSALTGETEDQFHCVYLMSKKGDVASGTICSPALALGIHWHHSYSKTLKFLMTVVAYGKKTQIIFANPNGTEFTFKKGITAEETPEAFERNLKLLTAIIVDGKEKEALTKFRQTLCAISTPWEDAALVGCYYFYMITDRFSPTQLSVYKSEMMPFRKMEAFSVWDHYQCCLQAINGVNPKTWLVENVSMSQKFQEYCDSFEPKNTIAEIENDHRERIENLAEEVVEKAEPNETPVVEEESPVEENFSEKKEEVKFENKKEVKSSLGFFKKITATKTSENTGKVKNVLVLPEENKPIVPIVEERTSNKPIIDLKEESDELEETNELDAVTETETVDETVDDSFDSDFDEVDFDEDLVDETPFDEEENDFEEKIEDGSNFEYEPTDNKTSEKEDSDFENDSDFEDDFETEEVNEKLAMYSNNKTPDQIVTSNTVTMYRFEETKTTVVLKNK